MRNLPESCFPPEIHSLFVSLGRVGFFERSVLIGSWVMPVYQVHRGIRYALRTTDIDFAVSLAHPRARMRDDLEALLLEDGSQQLDLWGINLYPDLEGEDWIEFDSLINLRPSAGNQTRGVDDEGIQAQIREVVRRWVNE